MSNASLTNMLLAPGLALRHVMQILQSSAHSRLGEAWTIKVTHTHTHTHCYFVKHQPPGSRDVWNSFIGFLCKIIETHSWVWNDKDLYPRLPAVPVSLSQLSLGSIWQTCTECLLWDNNWVRHFAVVQSLSCVWLFATPWTATHHTWDVRTIKMNKE